jgi:hypothetical protein
MRDPKLTTHALAQAEADRINRAGEAPPGCVAFAGKIDAWGLDDEFSYRVEYRPGR